MKHCASRLTSFGDARLPSARRLLTIRLKHASHFARQSRSNFIARRDLPFLLFARGTDLVVCSSGLHRIGWSVSKFEVGYWELVSQLGQGLNTEGVGAIVDFAFSVLGAPRVEALPDEANTRSCRLCERIGMAFEGTLRHHRGDPDGTARNTRVYSKVR